MTSNGFEPVAGPGARVLILGTLPGAASLASGQYYAQPRNAFWTIMGEVANAGPELPYEERLKQLEVRKIALWDVCASAVRPGSLDAAIQRASIVPNDFDGFFSAHPDLEVVCFNGQRAAALFERLVWARLGGQWSRLRLVTLPSTSPAYASVRVDQKIDAWRAALL